MKQLQFEEKTALSIDTSFNAEAEQRVYQDLTLKLDGSVTAGGGGAVAGLTLDAPLGILDRAQFYLGNEAFIDATAVSLWHFSALINGRYGKKTASTPGAGATAAYLVDIDLPFSRIRVPGAPPIPGIYIDGRHAQRRLAFKGKTGALASYASTNMSALSTNIRPWARTVEGIDPRQLKYHLLPEIKELEITVDSLTSTIQKGFSSAYDLFTFGFLLRQFDENQVGDAERTDGIVQKPTFKGKTLDLDGDLSTLRWGALQAQTAALFHINQAELKTGIAWVPTLRGTQPMRQRAGESIEIQPNVTETVEAEFTDVAPAAGDKLFVLSIAFRPVGPMGEPLTFSDIGIKG